MSLPDLTVKSLFSQDGKVVLVTGGGTGIGLMIATGFAQNGAKVYIASRKLSNLEKAAKALNAYRAGCCVPITADLTSKAGCDALAAELGRREPNGLDVLVNNSGVSWGSPMETVDETKGWDRVMAVNVKSLFYLTVALLPLLQKKAIDELHPSSVINITSILASLPYAYMPTAPRGSGAFSYTVSKAAAAQLTRVMSVSLKPKFINCNAIAPGFFESGMTSSAAKGDSTGGSHKPTDPLSRSHPNGRMGEAKDLAGPALFLASPAGAHLSGVTITSDGGFSLAPISRLPQELRELYEPLKLGKEQDGRAKL